jgi:hypothetical protein
MKSTVLRCIRATINYSALSNNSSAHNGATWIYKINYSNVESRGRPNYSPPFFECLCVPWDMLFAWSHSYGNVDIGHPFISSEAFQFICVFRLSVMVCCRLAGCTALLEISMYCGVCKSPSHELWAEFLTSLIDCLKLGRHCLRTSHEALGFSDWPVGVTSRSTGR